MGSSVWFFSLLSGAAWEWSWAGAGCMTHRWLKTTMSGGSVSCSVEVAVECTGCKLCSKLKIPCTPFIQGDHCHHREMHLNPRHHQVHHHHHHRQAKQEKAMVELSPIVMKKSTERQPKQFPRFMAVP